MKLLKAIGLGVVLWILIFFEVSILMFGFQLSKGMNYYIIHYLFLAIFTIILMFWYYSGRKKTKGGFFRGLFVGIIFIIVGIVLDAIITVPLFVVKQGGSYQSFFNDTYMFFGYLIIIVLAGIVGAVKRK